ncbi:MAG: MerC domain-containing protein [Chitinophagales bacterium]
MENHKFLKYSYWLSLACLIHCIAFPIIIATLPFLNIFVSINHTVELILIGSVIVLGSYSLFHAFLNHHKNILPLVLFFLGISLSVYIHIFNHEHSLNNTILEIVSGLIIAGSQFWNLKMTPKSCTH